MPMAVPIRSLDTAGPCCIALVKRVAVPPARADGGRVVIGRADDKFLRITHKIIQFMISCCIGSSFIYRFCYFYYIF